LEETIMTWTLAAILLSTPSLAGASKDLLPPIQIQAGSRPLDVERSGHSAPFVGDFYEDGGLCLLVGQYDGGRLRIYRNTGTRAQPRFDSYTWFMAGGKIARVPVG
jgi:hypothetical protein